MVRFIGALGLALATMVAASATDIPFDGAHVTPGLPIEIDAQTFAATYAWEGVSFSSNFYIDNEYGYGGLVTTPSAPNFARIVGADNTPDAITFLPGSNVHDVSFGTLGMSTDCTPCGVYDGAVVNFVGANGDVLWSTTIQPFVSNGVTPLASQTISFRSASAIAEITFSKFHDAGDPRGIFGFDNLYFSPDAVPEPSSFMLVGVGILAATLVRRRIASAAGQRR